MVSDFRKKKLLHVFNAFFDTNRSGSVDKSDFELSIKKIAELRGYKPGDEKYKQVEDILLQIWSGLQSRADADNDGEISQEEWITMWDNFAKNPSAAYNWQNLYCKFIFQLEDASNDGVIDENEFSSVYESFGLDKQESIEAFKKMAKGKATVSFEEFQELWKEYFLAEDQEAPGNFIFGCYICSLSKHSHSHSH
ncbi:calexcitin-2-like [Anticarsia gemmatalis]|uniref:calexcitin-2-like n=1 Tax=Anticarsia gemmatalis TaxID=129554 RepID=UPI003F75E692